MSSGRFFAWVALCAALCAAQGALAQAGLRIPDRGEGLDPTFARGWLAPDYDRFGFAYYTPGATPASRRLAHALVLCLRPARQLRHVGSEQPRLRARPPGLALRPLLALARLGVQRRDCRATRPAVRPQDFRFGVQRRF